MSSIENGNGSSMNKEVVSSQEEKRPGDEVQTSDNENTDSSYESGVSSDETDSDLDDASDDDTEEMSSEASSSDYTDSD